MNNEIITKPDTLNRSLVFLIGLWILSLFVRIPYMTTIVHSVLLVLIIFFCFVSHPSLINKKSITALFVFMLIAVLYLLVGKGIDFNGVIWLMLNFMACTAVCSIINFFTNKQLNLLFWLITVALIYSIVSTFFVLLENPMAVRDYGYGIERGASSFERELWYYYRSRGMYSYGIGEALAVITPAYLAFGLFHKEFWYKVIAFTIVIGSILTQVMASLATSALLTIVFSVITMLSYFYIARSRKKIGALVVISTLVVVAFVLVSFFISDELMFVLKMEQVGESIDTQNAVGGVNNRGNLYLRSISVFLHNPLLGLGDVPETFGVYTEHTVSWHTALFDYLGLYGMFTLLLYFAWKDSIMVSFRLLDNDQKVVFRWCMFSLLLLLTLKGPVTIINTYMFSTVFYGIIIYKYKILDYIQ